MATILVVDDRPTNREFLVTLLSDRGHRVLQAADGHEALAAVRAERPDLVITDILMPAMGGCEFVRQLRVDPANARTPVIVHTATYPPRQAEEMARSVGADLCLPKPAEPAEILKQVDRLLGLTDAASALHLPPELEEAGHRLLAEKLTRKVEELGRAHEELRARARQQATIAELGLLALAGGDLQELLQQATACVADVLAVELCKVLELLPGNTELLLRAGVGWKEGLVGQAVVSTGPDSQAGHTLASREPVVVEDLAAETRFRGPPLLLEHGVVSGLSVIIGAPSRPWGVLGAHTTHRRHFDRDQVSFLQSVANVLAQAIARKTMEAALQESERRAREQLTELEQIYQTSPLGLALLDRDLRWLRINDRLAEVDGCSAATHIGRTPREVIPEMAPTIEPLMRQVLETGEPVTDHEVHGVVPSQPGVERDWLVNFFPVRAEDGSVRAVSTVVQEITERKRAEQVVRDAERQLRRVLDTLPAMVGILAPDGTLLDGNRLPVETFGVKLDEVIGRPFGELYPWSTSPALQSELRAALQRAAAGEIVRYDVELPTPAGRSVVVDIWITPIKDEAGRVTRLIASGIDITERRRTQALLTESQQRLTLATKSAHIGIWDWDVAANKLVWDTQMYGLYGIRQQDFGGAYKAWEKGVHPEDRERAVAEVNAALDGVKDFHTQFRVVWPNGEVRHIEAHAVVQRAGNGSALRMIGLNWDITERQHAEQAIAQSELQLRKVLDNLLVFVGLFSTDGVVLEANRLPLEMANLSRADVIGQPFADTFWWSYSPDVQERLRSALRRAAAGEAVRYDEVVKMADGFITIDVCFAPMRDAQGAIVQLVGSAVDITDRKRAEQALRQAHADLEAAQSRARIGSWQFDLGAKIGTWSRQMYVLFERDPALGPPTIDESLDLVHAEDRPLIVQANGEAARLGRPIHGDFRTNPARLGERWFSVIADVVRDDAGAIIALAGTTMDITERKRAEQALRESNERLQALSRRIVEVQEEERRSLARELHDELGQVLTAVFYDLNALKTTSDPRAAARLDDSLAVVDQAIQRVRTLSLHLRPSMLDDLGLAPTVRWYAERLAQRTGVAIHLMVPPAGVELSAEVKIACFRVAQEAMTNVARHARAKEVWIELFQSDEEVRLVIRDDGVGFDVAAARQRAVRGGSVGILGMQERVELIGGHFDMESSPGKGTTIRVRFDLQELAEKLPKMGIAGGGK